MRLKLEGTCCTAHKHFLSDAVQSYSRLWTGWHGQPAQTQAVRLCRTRQSADRNLPRHTLTKYLKPANHTHSNNLQLNIQHGEYMPNSGLVTEWFALPGRVNFQRQICKLSTMTPVHKCNGTFEPRPGQLLGTFGKCTILHLSKTLCHMLARF